MRSSNIRSNTIVGGDLRNTGSTVPRSAPGEITVVGENASENGVFLTTHDSAGASSDRGFHLAVFC